MKREAAMLYYLIKVEFRMFKYKEMILKLKPKQDSKQDPQSVKK